ncbi:MAG: YnbE family lipoprotein [Alphaproteobacteria bacterium]|nr:YnbE family lipoprotein [Alphaproteobacteria bacterium]
MTKRFLLLAIPVLALVCACQPTVKLEAPDKPIEINLNVNIEQHVKVQIDRDLEKSMSKNKAIF